MCDLKKHTLFGACGILFFFFPALLSGQPAVLNQPITVREARSLPHDSWVILSGNIINALPGGTNFTFRDSTGEIIVEIGSRVWRGLNVGVSDRVEICGELRANRGQLNMNVRAINGEGRLNSRQGQALTLRNPVTVMELRNLPAESWVILSGNIINVLPGGRHYTFRDSTGEIIVGIDQNVWRGLYVGVDDRVEISGELRTNWGQATLDVRVIRNHESN